jgi:hypothetical protein
MCIYVNQGKYKGIMVIGREDEPTMVGENRKHLI